MPDAPQADLPVADDWSWASVPKPVASAGAGDRLRTWSADEADGGRSFPRRMMRFSLVVGRVAARAASTLLFGLLAVPAVLGPWIFQRLLLLDPLGVRTPRRSRWVPLGRAKRCAAHPWATDHALRPARPLRRIRTVVGVLVLLASVVIVTQRLTPAIVERVGYRPPAYADAPWWPRYQRELDFLGTPGVAWNPFDFQRMRDVDGEYIDIVDGRRVSWEPPPCAECRTVTAWIYGGSTVFGFGQRNEHTIASELARLAWDEGIRLVVENRGVSGDSHWEESRRFAWSVTSEVGPDLVLFYDGVNDLAAARTRNMRGGNGIDQPISIATDHVREEFRKDFATGGLLGMGIDPDPPPGMVFAEPPEESDLDAEELALRGVTDYDRAREVSRLVAVEHGIDVRFFWQPVRPSRPPIEGEPQGDDASERFLREHYAAAAAALAPDVVDLTHSMASSSEPIYYDDVHHNELGARLVAEAIWDDIAAAVGELAGVAS